MGSIFSRQMSRRNQNNSGNSTKHTGKAPQQPDDSIHSDCGERKTNAANDQRVDYRVLRCFCGCTPLSYEQVEQFATMNAEAVVNHPIGKSLLRNFLKIGQRTDKSAAMLSLDCFEMCNNILNDGCRDVDRIDELIELLPSFAWEEKINRAIDCDKNAHSKRNNNLNELLPDLKTECVRTIECHNDFDRFRRELLRKIAK